MEITMNNIVALVHRAMEKDLYVSSFGTTIWIYVEEKEAIEIRKEIKQGERYLEIYTKTGHISYPLTEKDFNIYKVLVDDVKQYYGDKAKNEFFSSCRELGVIID